MFYDVVPDYGGPDETFEVKVVQAPHVLVYRSQLGTMNLSWTVSLTEDAVEDDVATRVHLRLRLGPVRHP